MLPAAVVARVVEATDERAAVERADAVNVGAGLHEQADGERLELCGDREREVRRGFEVEIAFDQGARRHGLDGLPDVMTSRDVPEVGAAAGVD